MHSESVPAEITYRSILRVLLIGFSAVIGLFAAAGFIASRTVRDMRVEAAGLVQNATDSEELKKAIDAFNSAVQRSAPTSDFLTLHEHDKSRQSVRESEVLLAGSLFLALICAVMTLRIATKLVRGLDQQSRELSQVTWHMLQDQETTARRFSHELHDELGQSLTAIKANLSAMKMDSARRDDCKQLIDEAIRNVRELSQLLHPTILDDFGLDASLRWLAERFTERTSIEVDYESKFNERLPDESETHVFRIVQEALTNVARHSEATRVRIQLERRNGRIHLSLVDNGKGLTNSVQPRSGMGLTGMRARARSAGGELTVSSRNGDGVSIELWAPLHKLKTEGKTWPFES